MPTCNTVHNTAMKFIMYSVGMPPQLETWGGESPPHPPLPTPMLSIGDACCLRLAGGPQALWPSRALSLGGKERWGLLSIH